MRTHQPAVQQTNQSPLIMRKTCSCGRPMGPSSECAECRRKRQLGGTLQTKLRINQPGDKYEQEADRVAEQVMRMPEPSMRREGDEEDEEELLQIEPLVQRRLTDGRTGDEAPAIVYDVLSSPGRPLDQGTRSSMEWSFGHSFGAVRVHTGARAADSARGISAAAYTVGRDIVFAGGKYAPHTAEGHRLIAHELTHVVQQSASPSGADGRAITTGTVQREVEPGDFSKKKGQPKGISSAEAVLGAIKSTGEAFLRGSAGADKASSLVAKHSASVTSPAIANNMGRLVALSLQFNPGAPGQAGPTNAFVYTCQCGWIDMGHFFISAAGAFASAYVQQMGFRLEGRPYTQGQLLVMGLDELASTLERLLDTVAPGGKGKQILAQQRRLFESGEPRDISLGLGGYLTEYYQQLFKLVADSMTEAPQWLLGEQRSAFTTEDLPSDCYGADLGQTLWNRVSQSPHDISPVHSLMEQFFTDCRAVYPNENTFCRMMAETTPGSCRIEGGRARWPAEGESRGTPRQHITQTPYLLSSAEPVCGKSPQVRPCKSGAGPGPTRSPATELDLSLQDRSLTLISHENRKLFQPEERGEFGGEVKTPGRPEQIYPRPPLALRGPALVSANTAGEITGYSTLTGVPGLGDTRLLGQLDLSTGRVWAQASGPAIEVEASGRLHIDYVGLLRELGELAGPEVARFRAILESEAFMALLKKFATRAIDASEFYSQTRALLQAGFPEGYRRVGARLLESLQAHLNGELLAIYTGIRGTGAVRLFGLPISYFGVSKGTGRTSPLLGAEAGFLTTELFSRRAAAGVKLSVYGERVFQGHATSGVDLLSQKWYAEIYGESRELTGNELNLRLRAEYAPTTGESLFLVTFGGEHEIWGSK